MLRRSAGILQRRIFSQNMIEQDLIPSLEIRRGAMLFSNEDKAVLKARYATASGRNTESYDVFIERALEILVPDGTLAFVLPEAVLNQRHICVSAQFCFREVL